MGCQYCSDGDLRINPLGREPYSAPCQRAGNSTACAPQCLRSHRGVTQRTLAILQFKVLRGIVGSQNSQLLARSGVRGVEIIEIEPLNCLALTIAPAREKVIPAADRHAAFRGPRRKKGPGGVVTSYQRIFASRGGVERHREVGCVQPRRPTSRVCVEKYNSPRAIEDNRILDTTLSYRCAGGTAAVFCAPIRWASIPTSRRHLYLSSWRAVGRSAALTRSNWLKRRALDMPW